MFTKTTTLYIFNEREVALWSHTFQNHCELCDAVQRVHGNAGEADDGPLASGSKLKLCIPLVGSVTKTLEERPEA